MVAHTRAHLRPDHGDGVGAVGGDVDLFFDASDGFTQVEDAEVDAESVSMRDHNTLLIELSLLEGRP